VSEKSSYCGPKSFCELFPSATTHAKAANRLVVAVKW